MRGKYENSRPHIWGNNPKLNRHNLKGLVGCDKRGEDEFA